MSNNNWLFKLKNHTDAIIIRNVIVTNNRIVPAGTVGMLSPVPVSVRNILCDMKLKDGTKITLQKKCIRNLYPKERRKIIYNINSISFIHNETGKRVILASPAVGIIIEGNPDQRVQVLFLKISPSSWWSKFKEKLSILIKMFSNEVIDFTKKNYSHYIKIWLDPHEYDYLSSRDIKELEKFKGVVDLKDWFEDIIFHSQ